MITNVIDEFDIRNIEGDTVDEEVHYRKPKLFLVFIYIILTLFLGHNVIRYLNLNIEGDGILALSHYLTLPFLLLAYIMNRELVCFTKAEKYLIYSSLVIMLFQKIIMDKSAGFSFFLNSILEPVLLCSFLRMFDFFQQRKLRILLMIFLSLELLIGLYEYLTGNLVFAVSVDLLKMLTGQEEMRAYALHGHPLQNSFLVSLVMGCILASNLKMHIRYAFFFIGYIALFCFNSRAAIYCMGVILMLNLWSDFAMSQQSAGKKILLIILLPLALFCLIDFVQSHNLGTRLSIGMNANDSSSNARFVLVDILTRDMSVLDIFIGIPLASSMSFMAKYSLVAIENSIVNLIMGYGLIFTIIYFSCFFCIFKSILTSRLQLYTILIIMTILLNTNNALQTDCPIIPVAIMALFAFNETKNIRI